MSCSFPCARKARALLRKLRRLIADRIPATLPETGVEAGDEWTARVMLEVLTARIMKKSSTVVGAEMTPAASLNAAEAENTAVEDDELMTEKQLGQRHKNFHHKKVMKEEVLVKEQWMKI